ELVWSGSRGTIRIRQLSEPSARTICLPRTASLKRAASAMRQRDQPGLSGSGSWTKFVSGASATAKASDVPFGLHLLDLGDRARRRQALGADVGAVHDRVAAIEAEGIFQLVEPLAGHLVAAVRQPAIGLEQDCRAEELVGVPPVARARGRAAGAEDAFVEAVELLALLGALQAFLARWRG